MLDAAKAYSGFSVDDVGRARDFYADVLGVRVTETNGMLTLHVGGGRVLVYPKGSRHVPAEFTVLNFPVEDIAAAVDELAGRGVEFLRYPGMETDERGVFRAEGPPIAWFADPAGNVLSVIEER